MNERKACWLPSLSLVLLAVCSGVAWRAELEWRSGWAGLAWVGYFHWAVPVCVFAFVVWVVWVARVRRPFAFAVCLGGFAVAAYLAVDFVFRFCFFAGASPVRSLLFLRGGDHDAGLRGHWILPPAIVLFWACLPLAFCGICRGFGVPITIRGALMSAVLFVVSWPLAVFVRGFFEQIGSADLIHALKSGFVVPFLVIALGLPLLRLSADKGRQLEVV